MLMYSRSTLNQMSYEPFWQPLKKEILVCLLFVNLHLFRPHDLFILNNVLIFSYSPTASIRKTCAFFIQVYVRDRRQPHMSEGLKIFVLVWPVLPCLLAMFHPSVTLTWGFAQRKCSDLICSIHQSIINGYHFCLSGLTKGDSFCLGQGDHVIKVKRKKHTLCQVSAQSVIVRNMIMRWVKDPRDALDTRVSRARQHLSFQSWVMCSITPVQQWIQSRSLWNLSIP